MRHIPEDELHAYLDQALSRSQCIEIETHLAGCARCRDDRDLIAALRDRTTLLLASAAPRTTQGPPFAQLIARAEERRKTSWRRFAVLAAGLAGAVVAGWGMRAMLDPHTPAGVQVPVEVAIDDPVPAPEEPSVQISTVPATPSAPIREFAPVTTTPVRLAGIAPDRAGSSPASRPALTVRLSLGNGWVTRTREDAGVASQNLVPEVPGLLVSEIRMLAGEGPERPVMVVTQVLPGGGTIFTVEGPASAVAEFVAVQVASGDIRASEPTRSAPDYLPAGAGFERTPRMLAVIGPLPPDSLNALAQRVTLR